MRFWHIGSAFACAGAIVVGCAPGVSGSIEGAQPQPDAGGGLAAGAPPDAGSGIGTGPHVQPDGDSGLGADATTQPGADGGLGSQPTSGGVDSASPLPDAALASSPAPVIGGCQVFPPDNPWNTRVDDESAFPVHPNSATYIASMGATTHLHPDWGDWSTDHYGIPWQTVAANQPLVSMSFDDADQSDPGPYPFPPSARVEGGSGSGGDMHVLVVDTATCTLYETWSSIYTGPGWSCGSGAVFHLGSNALRPDGWTSADAAGLPILPGLVRMAEVSAGAIHHALRFTAETTQQAYIHPATHAAGKSDASLPPMGLRLRLKASFDPSRFSGPSKVILTAMQQYGLILADNGSNWFVTGDSDDGWSPLIDAISSAFSQVTGSDFEAVYTGPTM